MSSSNPELGEAVESVAVQYEGDELEVSFNAQYILDFLSVVEGRRSGFSTQRSRQARASWSRVNRGQRNVALQVRHHADEDVSVGLCETARCKPNKISKVTGHSRRSAPIDS